MVNLDSAKPEFEKTVAHLKAELAALRGTRATPALLEHVMVEAYGAKQPLRALASIAVIDPKTLAVEPWDKTIIKYLERAVQTANLGVSVAVDGQRIRINLPLLTEETRRELVKIVHDRIETARQSVRNLRERVRQQIMDAEKQKKITEDDKYKQLEKLDKMAGEYNEQIKKIGESKEKEIMTV